VYVLLADIVHLQGLTWVKAVPARKVAVGGGSMRP